MKKLAFTFGVITILGLSSCQKDWTCVCTDQSGNKGTTIFQDEYKFQATQRCKMLNYSSSTPEATISQTCKIQ